MENITIEDNKVYIVKESNKISNIKICEHSKNNLYVKVEDVESGKTKWRNITDFGDSIEVLDEVKVTTTKDEPKPITELPQAPIQIPQPIMSQIPTPINPYNTYNTARTQDIVNNIETLLLKLKQNIK